MNKKKKDKSRRVWLIVIALLVVLFGVELSANHGVLAKYITSRTQPQSLVTTNMFYFRSNYLTDAATTPEISLNPGTTSVDIELYNFADELRNSELDIQYTISVTSSNGGSGSLSKNTDVLTGVSAGTTKSTDTVTLSGLENGKSYTVTAVGKSKTNAQSTTYGGYEKTIKATFTVGSETPKVYKYLDKSNPDYCLLMVWTTGSAKGNAQIGYPVNLIPDNTDPAMSGWTTGPATNKAETTASFSDYYSSHTYRFFYTNGYNGKTDDSFDEADFAVNVGTTNAEIGTP